MADLEQQFQEAADKVKNLKTKPDNQELLSLYAFYKQATVGDNNQSKPSMLQLKEKAKHEVWLAKKGTDKNKAMQIYIEMVGDMIKKYGLN